MNVGRFNPIEITCSDVSTQISYTSFVYVQNRIILYGRVTKRFTHVTHGGLQIYFPFTHKTILDRENILLEWWVVRAEVFDIYARVLLFASLMSCKGVIVRTTVANLLETFCGWPLLSYTSRPKNSNCSTETSKRTRNSNLCTS